MIKISSKAWQKLKELWNCTNTNERGAIGDLKNGELISIDILQYTYQASDKFPFYRYFPSTIHTHPIHHDNVSIPSVEDLMNTISWDGPNATIILTTVCDFVVAKDGVYGYYPSSELVSLFTKHSNKTLLWKLLTSYLYHLFLMKAWDLISFETWKDQLQHLKMQEMTQRLRRNEEFIELVHTRTQYKLFSQWESVWEEWQQSDSKLNEISGFTVHHWHWPSFSDGTSSR
jgi:hypothetical protein